MTNRWKRFGRRVVATGVLLTALVAILVAQLTLTKEQNAAVKRMAIILAENQAATIDSTIATSGFHHALAPGVWEAFPTVRKIEAVLYATEQVAPGRGADQALALMARSLAQQYQSAKADPALQTYLASNTTSTTVKPLQLAHAPEPAQIQLSKPQQAAVRTISKYFEYGNDGGPYNILAFHCGLPEERVYEILRSSATVEEALSRGFSSLTEPGRTRSFRSTIEYLDRTFQTSRYASEFESWRPSKPAEYARGANDARNTPSAPGASVGGDAGGGTNGRGDRSTATNPAGEAEGPVVRRPASVASEPAPPRAADSSSGGSVSSSYRRFSESRYSTPISRGFEVMAEGEWGFGGVVVGNNVTAKGALAGRLQSARWLPVAGDPENGEVLFTIEGMPAPVRAQLRQEDAWAAWRIVFEGAEDVGPMKEGDGVGLVSLNPIDTAYELHDQFLANLGRRFRVTVHPAFDGLALEESIVLIDALPIGDALDRLLSKGSADPADSSPFEGLANWKIIDRPLQVTLNNGHIDVTAAQGRNPAIRFSAVGFARSDIDDDDDDLAEGFSAKFDAVAPALVKASSDYARFNEFLRAVALYRWMKVKGIKDAPHPAVRPVSASVHPITFLAVGDDDLTVWHDADRHVRPSALRREMFAKLRALVDGAPANIRDSVEAIDSGLEESARIAGEAGDVREQMNERLDSLGSVEAEIKFRAAKAPTERHRNALEDLQLGLETLRREPEEFDLTGAAGLSAEAKAVLARFKSTVPLLQARLDEVEDRLIEGSVPLSLTEDLAESLDPDLAKRQAQADAERQRIETRDRQIEDQKAALFEKAGKILDPEVVGQLAQLEQSALDLIQEQHEPALAQSIRAGLSNLWHEWLPELAASRVNLWDATLAESSARAALRQQREQIDRSREEAVSKAWPAYRQWESLAREIETSLDFR